MVLGKSFKSQLEKGFTLVELLVVIAVLGVLAAVVLVAINPVEQLARARDAGRKTSLGQISKAVLAYYTSQNAAYPTANATWVTSLVSAGEVKAVPAATTYSVSGTAACTTNAQNTFCYNTDGGTSPEVATWVRLESGSEKNKCTAYVGTNSYFLWSSKDGQTGVICLSAEPTAAQITSGFTGVNGGYH